MSFLPTSGRSGLDSFDVTPAVFLQLREQLADGRKLPFNENQLLIAFSRYLRDNKGKGVLKKVDPKEIKDLHKFAQSFVKKETQKLEDKFGKNSSQPTTHKQATAKQQKAEKFINDHGLKLLDDKQIPKGETANDKSSSLLTEKNLERTVDATELVSELFAVARAADPGIAVAAVLLSYTLLPNMSSMAIRGTHLLLDKFETRTSTSQEKDVVLHGLEVVTANIAPSHYSKELASVQTKERGNPQANPQHLERLEKIKGETEYTAKQEREKAETLASVDIMLASFYENLEMLALHSDDKRAIKQTHEKIAAAEMPVYSQASHNLMLDLRKGPKPPTDEIFGVRRTTHEENA